MQSRGRWTEKIKSPAEMSFVAKRPLLAVGESLTIALPRSDTDCSLDCSGCVVAMDGVRELPLRGQVHKVVEVIFKHNTTTISSFLSFISNQDFVPSHNTAQKQQQDRFSLL
jgi:hypothetical protein